MEDSPGPGAGFTNQEVRDPCDSVTDTLIRNLVPVFLFVVCLNNTEAAERQMRSASLVAHILAVRRKRKI